MFSVFSVKKKGRKGWFLLWIYGVCFIGKKPQLQHITWTCSTWSLWEGFFLSLSGQCTSADWLKKMVDWVGTITQLKWFCICYYCFPGAIWSWSETLTLSYNATDSMTSRLEFWARTGGGGIVIDDNTS